jgi:CP family cyanate transporter-like MFS transporter
MRMQAPLMPLSQSNFPAPTSELQLIDAEIDSMPPPLPTPVRSRASRLLLALSLVLIAFNLRPLFSSLSVVLPDIMRATGLSAIAASFLTTLPVLCLGVFAPFAPPLARRFGTEHTLLGVLVVLALGTILRGAGNLPLLFFASALAGAAIAVGNVLLPSLVKRDFPDHAGVMTGLYTMAVCGGAAGAAALTVPLQRLLDNRWTYALAGWALPVCLVALIWIAQTRRTQAGVRHAGHRVRGLWRDPLAWQVTLFMGLQAALAYAVFGWLAPILRDRGLDAVSAGLVLSVSSMSQLAACLFIPSFAIRCKDQRWLNVALAGAAVAGFLGMLSAPLGGVWYWAVLLGLSQGGLLSVSLTLIVLRSPDGPVTAQLSSMAQSVGYVLATVGPLMVGLMHTWTGNYRSAGPLFVALGIGAALSGFGAGRAAHVRALVTPR